jgi:hypothetical protein
MEVALRVLGRAAVAAARGARQMGELGATDGGTARWGAGQVARDPLLVRPRPRPLRGGRGGGHACGKIVLCRDHALAQRVARELAPHDWVLVKGSRSARMERVVERLAARGKD